MVLGSWPSDRCDISWVTQRLANRAPETTSARKWPFSLAQQMLHPAGKELQRTFQQLTEERHNIFMSACNIDLMNKLYRVNLGIGMSFSSTEDADGLLVYDTPRVHATISGTEQELTIAQHNNIETLWYNALPSRVAYGEESYQYTEVIPRTQISDLASVTPADLTIDGHLYITIRDNTTWEYRGRDQIYYPKVYIRGTTRKRTEEEEAIPIQYNGTFKTVNQWHSVESVFVSYMDDAAYITIEVLPFDRASILDTRNLIVPSSGMENWKFLRVGSQVWGSTLLSEGFVSNDLEIIHLGVDEKDVEYEIELLDESGSNVDILAATLKPHTDYLLAMDSTNLYIYHTGLPYPDMTRLTAESPDTQMDFHSDRWVYTRDSVAVVNTDNLNKTEVPWRFRWTLEEPDGRTYYLGVDGSKWPTSTDAWVWNTRWESAEWKEQRMEILLDQVGTYIITIECLYSDPDYPGKDRTLTTKHLLYVPAIQPEVTLALPAQLNSPSDIMFDSDGRIWAQVSGAVELMNLYYDYFMADYEKNTIWLRENYSSVRVVT